MTRSSRTWCALAGAVLILIGVSGLPHSLSERRIARDLAQNGIEVEALITGVSQESRQLRWPRSGTTTTRAPVTRFRADIRLPVDRPEAVADLQISQAEHAAYMAGRNDRITVNHLPDRPYQIERVRGARLAEAPPVGRAFWFIGPGLVLLAGAGLWRAAPRA